MMELLKQFNEVYSANGGNPSQCLTEHWMKGFVIHIPDLFCIGYFYEENGLVICHVTYCGGEFRKALQIASNFELDILEYYRNFRGQMKRVPFDSIYRRICHG